MRYRLYILDRHDRVTGAQDLMCDTEGEALAFAEASPGGDMRELWLGSDRIARRALETTP